MPGIGQKILGGVTQALLLPVYCVAWLLGSPYLMTMLCIMSEVLVELVVSTVMAGVSLIVSAVILIEEDPRPLNDGTSLHLKSLYERGDDSKTKDKGSSTFSLEEGLQPKKVSTFVDPNQGSFFSTSSIEDPLVDGEKQKSKEDNDEGMTAGKASSQKSLEPKQSPAGSIKSGASLTG